MRVPNFWNQLLRIRLRSHCCAHVNDDYPIQDTVQKTCSKDIS